MTTSGTLRSDVAEVAPELTDLRHRLHRAPEIGLQLPRTQETLLEALGDLGLELTLGQSVTSITGVLRGGRSTGTAVLLRADMDALPVQERSGEPFSSEIDGAMHACGHDLHMSALVASAGIMARSKDAWHGTLMLIGQPAEETISGAAAMVQGGLFTRFPRPDVVLALHVGNELPAGKVGIVPGIYNTNADSLRITIYGKGGHGSAPHTTVDPIVTAARTILALQTISSREVKPGELAVITVGYINAGTKNNIIPDQAELGLTVRTYKAEVRKQVLAAITRITNAEAQAAGAPRAPSIDRYEMTDAVYNDPALAQQLRSALESTLSKDNVIMTAPITASEDFSAFIAQGIPGFYLSLGGANPEQYAAATAAGTHLPSNHSALFAPAVDPALHTAIAAEVGMLRSLLKADGRT